MRVCVREGADTARTGYHPPARMISSEVMTMSDDSMPALTLASGLAPNAVGSATIATFKLLPEDAQAVVSAKLTPPRVAGGYALLAGVGFAVCTCHNAVVQISGRRTRKLFDFAVPLGAKMPRGDDQIPRLPRSPGHASAGTQHAGTACHVTGRLAHAWAHISRHPRGGKKQADELRCLAHSHFVGDHPAPEHKVLRRIQTT
jgi:hypothetical protein